MKLAAAALRDAEVPYILGGGLAAWARGGPPTEHDVDFFVREEDAERALEALEAAGMKPERPPEGWLLKAWAGETLIDLIFHPAGGPVDDGYFERAEEIEVASQRMPVASLEDVMTTKLMALTEQEPDLSLGARARALAPGADRLGARPRAHGRVAVRASLLHPRRGARRRRAGRLGGRPARLSAYLTALKALTSPAP